MNHKSNALYLNAPSMIRIMGITAITLILFSLQSLRAYSPVWNINKWDAAMLKDSGITVTRWKHDTIGEEPAMQWIEVTYNHSKFAEDQEVLMTLHVLGKDLQTISTTRSEHRKGEAGKVKLIFAVSGNHLENSYVEILFPERLAKMNQRALGDPGLGGYSLQISRILQLAAENPAGNPNSKAKATPAADPQPPAAAPAP